MAANARCLPRQLSAIGSAYPHRPRQRKSRCIFLARRGSCRDCWIDVEIFGIEVNIEWIECDPGCNVRSWRVPLTAITTAARFFPIGPPALAALLVIAVNRFVDSPAAKVWPLGHDGRAPSCACRNWSVTSNGICCPNRQPSVSPISNLPSSKYLFEGAPPPQK